MLLSVKASLLLVLISALQTASAIETCPPPEKLKPCICHDSRVYCTNMFSEREFKISMQSCREANCMYVLIKDSKLNYFPSDAFEGTSIKEVEIEDSSIISLSDTDVAFKGIDEMFSFRVSNCKFTNMWKLTQLEGKGSLMYLTIHAGDLEFVPEFASLPTLEEVALSKNRISYIHPTAFATVSKMMTMDLENNQIRELKRSMFPKPANELRMFYLGFNKLQALPDDIFTEMPGLNTIFLSGNQFYTFKQDSFKPVWNQLSLLFLDRNPLRCDCRVVWMTKQKKITKFRAFCQDPVEVRGKDVTTLNERDLWCYFHPPSEQKEE